MKDVLTYEDAIPLARKLADDVEAAYDAITALDAEIGDGDLGVTCRLGMNAVLGVLPTLGAASANEILMKAGMTFNTAAASTLGALVATGAMRAAKYAKENDVQVWDLDHIIGALAAAIDGIEQRGKAIRGDKTVLDALWPAIVTLQAAQADGSLLAEALDRAAVAAAEGAEATRPLRSKFGRAGWAQDRSVGVPDPGAVVVALVIGSVAGYVKA